MCLRPQVGSNLYVAGGVGYSGNLLASIEVVDLVAGVTGFVPAALPQPLSYPAAVVSSCQVRACTPCLHSDACLRCVDSLHTHTPPHASPPSAHAKYRHHQPTNPHPQVYLLGGTTSRGVNTGAVFVLSPAPNNATLFPFPGSLLEPRTQFSGFVAAAGGVITVVGGSSGGDSEDVTPCPPQYTGPDCLAPTPDTQCSPGYLRVGGECTPW